MLPPDGDDEPLSEEQLPRGDGMPSAALYRGSLIALAVTTLVAVFLFVSPPESESSIEPPRTVATPTRTPTPSPTQGGATQATPSPSAQATNAASPTAAATASPGAEQTYTVASGDTLSGIAARFNTTVEALLAANPGVTPETLQIGQVLRIPAGGGQ